MDGTFEGDRRNHNADFHRLKPPTFGGTTDPLMIENWIIDMEKCFDIVKCSNTEKVAYATFMLREGAFDWWNAHRKSYPEGTILTWEIFKQAFYQKYFPLSIQRQKEREFLDLKQGGKSVAEYEMELSKLVRYAFENAQNGIKKAQRFEDGLNPIICGRVKVFALNILREVVNKA